jgi:hypothetical protein
LIHPWTSATHLKCVVYIVSKTIGARQATLKCIGDATQVPGAIV